MFGKVAVLGAGVMGGQIAAHLANARVPSLLLDRVLPEHAGSRDPAGRNKLAREGLERAKKMKPAAFFSPGFEALVEVGNFDDHWGRLAVADWIIEAVAEVIEIKQQLFEKLEGVRKPGSIVSSNTSGLLIADMARGRSDDFRKHFLGTHFFNPPRYMRLLEIIPAGDTLPGVVEAVAAFGRDVLGKGVVFCKDTPCFIANRVGTLAVCLVIRAMQALDLGIDEVDELTGPLIGRPKSATFRTLDRVGLDTFVHVAENLHRALPGDSFREYFSLPDFILKMVERNWLGEKSGQGFYKKISADGRSEILVLDWRTLEYKPRGRSRLASLEMAKTAEHLKDRLKVLSAAKDKAGEFFWMTTGPMLAYAAAAVPEIAGSIVEVDRAMRWGFNWDLGPFELWDCLGVEPAAKKIGERGISVPSWVSSMPGPEKRFYAEEDGEAVYYDGVERKRKVLEADPRNINLRALKASPGKILKENAGASLIDIGRNILCFEFHSKMNVIGEDALRLSEEAFRLLEDRYDGMVVGNQGENFCVGANLMLILMLAEEEEWDELDRAVRFFQRMTMGMKYAKKPVVAAPFGRALGGGCEIALHASRVCAHAETYMGLVEIGAGLIPAGGGTKEMVCRTAGRPGLLVRDPVKSLEKAFETIALARVSTSADEGKRIGYLRPEDVVYMNGDQLLFEARELAVSLAGEGYRPAVESPVTVYGKTVYANLLVGIYLMREAGRITEYEAHLARKLATVMSGGDLSAPQPVSEEYLLDLERETFLSLAGEKKTQERMRHLLKYGKPLRN